MTATVIKVTQHDPVHSHCYEEAGPVCTIEAPQRKFVQELIELFHAQGYWVETFDPETNELLLGPFDPGRPLPEKLHHLV